MADYYLRTAFSIFRTSDTGSLPGGIPQEQEVLLTTSVNMLQNSQRLSTTHEVLVFNDLAGPCKCLLKNTNAVAIISVGVVVASTFYPLFTIAPGERATLSRLSSLAGTFLLSSVVDTYCEVTLYEIAV